METIIVIFISILVLLVLFRLGVENLKTHELNFILDKYGSIQVFDNQGLVAILYRNRAVEWHRSTSFFKMVKIKEISDNFDEYYNKLKEEESCH